MHAIIPSTSFYRLSIIFRRSVIFRKSIFSQPVHSLSYISNLKEIFPFILNVVNDEISVISKVLIINDLWFYKNVSM